MRVRKIGEPCKEGEFFFFFFWKVGNKTFQLAFSRELSTELLYVSGKIRQKLEIREPKFILGKLLEGSAPLGPRV